MNRIYRGKVTNMEIYNPRILSAPAATARQRGESNAVPRSRERERLAEGRMR